MDKLKEGKSALIGASVFAVLTDIVLMISYSSGSAGLVGTLILLFLIYIDVEWARWLLVLRAGFGVFFGISWVISTGDFLWLLPVGAHFIIAWMFGKDPEIDAYIKRQQEA